MKKAKVLEYLDEECIMTMSPDSMVRELCEISGIELVKMLYRSHEGSRGYIPMLHSIDLLWQKVIKDNFDLNLREMQELTGLSVITIKRIKRELVETGKVQVKNQVRLFEGEEEEREDEDN